MIEAAGRMLACLRCAGLVCSLLMSSLALADTAPVLRATLANGLRVIIVRNTLAPVVATSVNYLVGSDEAPPGFPGHGACAGTHDVSRQPGPHRRPAGRHRQHHGRQLQRQYAEEPDAIPLHGSGRGSRRRAAHRGPRACAACSIRRASGIRSAAPSSRKSRRTCPTPATCCTPSCARRCSPARPTRTMRSARGRRSTRPPAQMLKQFHDAWYAPNNAILVIVGDVDPQATLTKVEAAVRRHRRQAAAGAAPVNLQPACGATRSASTPISPNGTQMIATRVPGPDSADFPALEVLADVLSSQRFELYGLVPQGKALDAGFSLDPLPQAGPRLRRRFPFPPATTRRRSSPRCARS